MGCVSSNALHMEGDQMRRPKFVPGNSLGSFTFERLRMAPAYVCVKHSKLAFICVVRELLPPNTKCVHMCCH